MTGQEKAPLNAKTLKIVLEKAIETRIAKYRSEQTLASRPKNTKGSISHYINAQEIERMLERIISKLGGGVLEMGKVFVSVKDKNGGPVASNSDCDKIIVAVAYGQELIIKNKEYPPKENGTGMTESSPVPKQAGPANKADHDKDPIRAKQIELVKEIKRKIDKLWTNRKGLGVDFNSPGALKIELLQDSPRITKMAKEIGIEMLDVRIDRKSGLIKVCDGSKTYLKWEFPKDEM